MFHKTTTLIVAFILFAVTGIVLADAAFAVTFEKACANAVPLELDSTWRGYGEGPEETHFFSLEIPTAGIASIEVVTPGSSEVEPKLGFLDRGCAGPDVDRGFATIERSASHRLIAFPAAGSYLLRVAAQDPRRPLGGYKLRTAFVPAEVATAELDLELDGSRDPLLVEETRFYFDDGRKSDEDEVDPNPKSLSFGRDAHLSLVTFLTTPWGKSDEDEVDPNPKADQGLRGARLVLLSDARSWTKSDEDEVDPNPKAAEPMPTRWVTFSVDDVYGARSDRRPALLGWLAELIFSDAAAAAADDRFQVLSYAGADAAPGFRHDGLCRAGELDDHGDTFGCATTVRLGRTAGGEIGNGWGDDADVFSFTLDRLQTVSIAGTGGLDARGGLYDRFGQRLAASDGGGRGASFRIVKTLAPGRYFIRVEGARQAEGSYGLTVEEQAW